MRIILQLRSHTDTLQRLPPSISVPFLAISDYLEIPPVATYAAVCLWNFKPLFADEHVDSLENLATLTTFTGSIDESWFYLTSVAIEARGAPIIPLMLEAMRAARANDASTVTWCLQSFAERLDDLSALLKRMNEGCDPHVFYHRIRPFLAGSKGMADAGLPRGVLYDDGTPASKFYQYSGGSNAQSSLIQFFDIVLGIEHHPTGVKKDNTGSDAEGRLPPPSHNFIQDMRSYMPGQHRRFLQDVTLCANIRDFVEAHPENRGLCIAYDACLMMLSSLRSVHLNIVSRYIIIPASQAKRNSKGTLESEKQNLATASQGEVGKKKLKGTGGTDLVRFLQQARDETDEPVVDQWTRRAINRGKAKTGHGDFFLGKVGEKANGEVEVNGLAGMWTMDSFEGGGGLCHY